MNKNVLGFFKRLVIFVALFYVVDRALGYAVLYAYLNKKNSNSEVTTHAVLKANEDILVYGSSRAAHHYDCKILTDSTGLSAFNCGKDGANIIYYDAILHSAVERHKPKAVVLDLIANDIAVSDKVKRKQDVIASMLLPYVRRDREIQKAIAEVDPAEVYKAKLSVMYLCNSLVLQSFANKVGGSSKEFINGFQPLKGSKVAATLPVYDDYNAVDTLSKRKLEDFVQTVRSKNIPLYAVISPMYFAQFKNTPSMDTMRAIMKRNNVELWDYSQDTSYKKKEFFYDNGHMNIKGSERFTCDIASKIKKDLSAQTNNKPLELTKK